MEDYLKKPCTETELQCIDLSEHEDEREINVYATAKLPMPYDIVSIKIVVAGNLSAFRVQLSSDHSHRFCVDLCILW